MIALELPADVEGRLGELADEIGKTRTGLAHDWIIERLNREALNRKIRDNSFVNEAERQHAIEVTGGDATDAWLRWLDAEDGGYNWGPNGPPA